MTILLLQSGPGVAGGAAVPAEVAQFLARTTGLNTTHTNAYTALINGLVTDGLWSKLDVLRIYATQDSTTALLNLKSSSFTAVPHGSPTFTADRGFAGVDSSTTVYIDSGYNPVTAGGVFTQNSAHVSAWGVTDASGCNIGLNSGAYNTKIFPSLTTTVNSYYSLNGGNNALIVGIVGSGLGHHIINRSASNALQAYKNGSANGSNSDGSTALYSGNFYELANNNAGTGASGNSNQLGVTSIGSSLSSTDATKFYNRLRTYLTAVGVP